jgi:outer membrane protein OmpA-like peptidoglycan-associated protein
MKRQPRILAGTAIGLLMASAPLGASSLSGGPFDFAVRTTQAPFVLVQAECEGEDCPPKTRRQERQERRQERQQQQQEEQQQAPAEEAAPEPQAEQEPEPKAEPAPEPRAEPEPQAAPEPEPAPAQQAPDEQPPAAEEPAPEPEAEPEQAPAEQAPAEEAPEEEAPAEQQTAPEEQQDPAQEEPSEEAPAEEKPAEQAPAQEPQAEQPAQEQPNQQQPEGQQPPSEQPADGQQPEQSGEVDPDAPTADPNAAPVLDSQKEASPGQPGEEPQQDEQAAQPAPADQGPPPQSDAEAQVERIAPEQIQPVTAEEGQRIEVGQSREERRRFRQERRERRDDAEVIEEFNDNRVIIEINNHTYIDSPDYDRIIRDRDDVYYEELPRGRIREVITRPNGVRIVTVRNRYGDIIRRSRIEPDNREVILVYVEDRYYQDEGQWRDPGLDLPPMRLTIPREEYILDAAYVDDPGDYYEFLEQPPVERVERTYSLTEVKRSARIRDKVRRIDMDTLTFEFGSASIPESEVRKLEGVADAMQKLLERNPAETFLLEGHTDAVGSDLANLALSDKRAESVAEALTNVFDIPPENLATQGYGEQYLKVNTEERERENRRVAIRRVTPLVAPVASAN